MSAPKLPCSTCRRRHIKYDKQRPKCGRCQSRNLECVAVERKAVFRRGSKDIPVEGFAVHQTWVNSTPRKWRGAKAAAEGSGSGTGSRGAKRSKSSPTASEPTSHEILAKQPPAVPEEAAAEGEGDPIQIQIQAGDSAAGGHFVPAFQEQDLDQPILSDSYPIPTSTTVSGLDALVSAAVGIHHVHESPVSGGSIGASHGSPYVYGLGVIHNHDHSHDHISPLTTISPGNDTDVQPLANVEEACLLRYYIEELSPWFDHCDNQSHFRLVVPLRANTCLTLRNAIFAVSSRHLSRLPQFKTSRGIVYHGQCLSGLSTSSAVEYMLKCIPGLSSFHTVLDPRVQENLMAAAIILRQYEEMEEEMEEGGDCDPDDDDDIGGSTGADGNGSGGGRQQRVNFLAITKTIIYSMISSPLARSSLAAAAYWIAIRQEVYYALTRKRAPCVAFTPEDWANATVANVMIMHTGEVAKWCWGERSVAEYERLRTHQQQLITTYASHILPMLQKPVDKAKGEIFPTVWYTTPWQVTGVQHLELARMILIAENPRLRNPTAPRATHRKAESLIRNIVLNLCGIAVDNLSLGLPALVNAVIAILLYGEYFTEQRERDALRGIIDRTKDMHAWPLRRPYERLCRLWEEGDAVEV
ncbi:uncharacterized protein BDV17DRAFT_276605 [Aspergillus undulatus]|uniref:uncharacterized protein n=1 Tax=Aspergillus undulatus TaxID=1810928 RepID=UPI003CCCA8DB